MTHRKNYKDALKDCTRDQQMYIAVIKAGNDYT